MRTGRPTPALVIVAIVLLAAACTSSPAASGPPRVATAPSAAAASATPTDTPTPPADARTPVASGPGDAWLVVGRPGEDALRVMLASSGEEDYELPIGIPDETWGRLLTVQPGFGGPLRTIDGAWRLPTVGLDPIPVGLSADGSTIVLVEDRDGGAAAPAVSRFAVLDRGLRSAPRIIELKGVFEFDTVSPDGSILYVAEHVPGPLAGRYQVRAVDTATGVMRDAIIVDKRNIDEEMAGWPVDQELRSDGTVLTLYRGVEHPFIHALHTIDAWAVCIDLPAAGMDDPQAASDWGVITLPDGRSSLAINASLGIIVDVDADLTVRRTVVFEPSARNTITLAKFGHIEPGAVGRRLVAAPDGSAVFAAGARGIVRIETADLTVSGRWLEGRAVDAVAVLPDGSAIYALVRDGGRIARLDPRTGEVLGWAAGEGYDRLVGIVPW
jgi:hypothetical protein